MNKGTEIIESGSMIRSWGCSVALHTAVLGLGMWLMSQQTIVSPPHFQWEVSLVSLSQQLSSDVPVSSASSRGHDRTRPVVQKVGGKPAAAAIPVHPVIHTAQSVVAAARPNQRETNHSTEFSLSDLVAPHQAIEQAPNAIDDETQVPHVPSAPLPLAADQHADGSSDPLTDVTVPSTTVTHASSLETAPDFGWLMQMLWSRVTELKHYPSEARMNRWEGRVVVRVVIDAQGKLLDAAIVIGSGYEALDRAALEVIKESCPLILSRPLGRQQIVLKIPIQYSLSS